MKSSYLEESEHHSSTWTITNGLFSEKQRHMYSTFDNVFILDVCRFQLHKKATKAWKRHMHTRDSKETPQIFFRCNGMGLFQKYFFSFSKECQQRKIIYKIGWLRFKCAVSSWRDHISLYTRLVFFERNRCTAMATEFFGSVIGGECVNGRSRKILWRSATSHCWFVERNYGTSQHHFF